MEDADRSGSVCLPSVALPLLGSVISAGLLSKASSETRKTRRVATGTLPQNINVASTHARSENQLASQSKLSLKALTNTLDQQLFTTNWSLAVDWQRATLTQKFPQFCQKRSLTGRTRPQQRRSVKRKHTECLKLLRNLPFHHCVPTTSREIWQIWSCHCYKSFLDITSLALVVRNFHTMVRNSDNNKKQEWKVTAELVPTILGVLDYLLFEIFKKAIKDFQEVLDWILIASDDIFPWNHTSIL